MKQLILILAIFLTASINAQDPLTKDVGDFSELKVYDLIEVNLIQSEENKVVITGKNIEDVVVVNKNEVLKIRMNLEETFDGDETTVTVYYKTIDIIDANEGATIKSDGIIKQFEIDFKAQEGGKIYAEIDVNYVNIKSVSGGRVQIKGIAKTQAVSVSTGGSYFGRKNITDNTKVVIKAAGEAHVNATIEVDAKVRAGGSVYVYGSPETLTENKVLGGKIKLMDN